MRLLPASRWGRRLRSMNFDGTAIHLLTCAGVASDGQTNSASSITSTLAQLSLDIPSSYNIAPTSFQPVIRLDR